MKFETKKFIYIKFLPKEIIKLNLSINTNNNKIITDGY